MKWPRQTVRLFDSSAKRTQRMLSADELIKKGLAHSQASPCYHHF